MYELENVGARAAVESTGPLIYILIYILYMHILGGERGAVLIYILVYIHILYYILILYSDAYGYILIYILTYVHTLYSDSDVYIYTYSYIRWRAWGRSYID